MLVINKIIMCMNNLYKKHVSYNPGTSVSFYFKPIYLLNSDYNDASCLPHLPNSHSCTELLNSVLNHAHV